MENQKILEFVQQSKMGNNDAFTELFKEYYKYLYTTAYFLLGNSEDAADAVQDTYLRSYFYIKKLRNEEYFKTWITKILINQCKSFNIKRNFTMEINNEILYGSQLDENEILIWQLVNELNIKHKLVIILRFKNDLKISEIAKILGCSEGTIKSRLNRALEQLKKDLYKEE